MNQYLTPLLLQATAWRDGLQYIRVLLTAPFDAHSVLSEYKGRTALWFAVKTELGNAGKYKDYSITLDLQALLVATYFAVLQNRCAIVNDNDWKLFQEVLHQTNEEGTSPSSTFQSLLFRSLVSCSPLLDKYSVKLFDLMTTTLLEKWPHLTDSSGQHILHWLCQLGSTNAAAMFCEHVLKVLDRDHSVDSLLLRPCNLNGNLPLHVAACNPCCTILERLCRCQRSLAIRNRFGELPLHLALLSRNKRGAECLWKADPSALLVQHGPTGLCAFAVLAAKSPEMVSSEMDILRIYPTPEIVDLEQVTLIYELLRAAPDALGLHTEAILETTE